MICASLWRPVSAHMLPNGDANQVFRLVVTWIAIDMMDVKSGLNFAVMVAIHPLMQIFWDVVASGQPEVILVRGAVAVWIAPISFPGVSNQFNLNVFFIHDGFA